jgi:hypothetical protein
MFVGVMLLPTLLVPGTIKVGLATFILWSGAYLVSWIHAKDIQKLMEKKK